MTDDCDENVNMSLILLDIVILGTPSYPKGPHKGDLWPIKCTSNTPHVGRGGERATIQTHHTHLLNHLRQRCVCVCVQVNAFVTWPMIQLVSLAKYKLSVDLLGVSFNITLFLENRMYV